MNKTNFYIRNASGDFTVARGAELYCGGYHFAYVPCAVERHYNIYDVDTGMLVEMAVQLARFVKVIEWYITTVKGMPNYYGSLMRELNEYMAGNA